MYEAIMILITFVAVFALVPKWRQIKSLQTVINDENDKSKTIDEKNQSIDEEHSARTFWQR